MVVDNTSCPEDEEKSKEEAKPNLLESIFGAGKREEKGKEKTEEEEESKPPSLLESIFSSASKKGKGVVSLAADSTLTNVTPLEITKADEADEPDEPNPPNPLDAMTQLLQNLKKQTEDKAKEATQPPTQPLVEQRPAAAGEKSPKVLIFGDELISDLDKVCHTRGFCLKAR